MKYLKKYEHLDDLPEAYKNEIMVNPKYNQQKRAENFLEDIFDTNNPRRRRYIKGVLMGLSQNNLDYITNDLATVNEIRFFEFIERELTGEVSNSDVPFYGEYQKQVNDIIKRAFVLTPVAKSTNKFGL